MASATAGVTDAGGPSNVTRPRRKPTTHRPALVLLDMMMPDADGADFLMRLSALGEAAAVPVIVVSALGPLRQGLRRSDVNAAGVAEVLAKPVSYTR
jgi:CheY-like chemotaxis protein